MVASCLPSIVLGLALFIYHQGLSKGRSIDNNHDKNTCTGQIHLAEWGNIKEEWSEQVSEVFRVKNMLGDLPQLKVQLENMKVLSKKLDGEVREVRNTSKIYKKANGKMELADEACSKLGGQLPEPRTDAEVNNLHAVMERLEVVKQPFIVYLHGGQVRYRNSGRKLPMTVTGDYEVGETMVAHQRNHATAVASTAWTKTDNTADFVCELTVPVNQRGELNSAYFNDLLDEVEIYTDEWEETILDVEELYGTMDIIKDNDEAQLIAVRDAVSPMSVAISSLTAALKLSDDLTELDEGIERVKEAADDMEDFKAKREMLVRPTQELLKSIYKLFKIRGGSGYGVSSISFLPSRSSPEYIYGKVQVSLQSAPMELEKVTWMSAEETMVDSYLVHRGSDQPFTITERELDKCEEASEVWTCPRMDQRDKGYDCGTDVVKGKIDNCKTEAVFNPKPLSFQVDCSGFENFVDNNHEILKEDCTDGKESFIDLAEPSLINTACDLVSVAGQIVLEKNRMTTASDFEAMQDYITLDKLPKEIWGFLWEWKRTIGFGIGGAAVAAMAYCVLGFLCTPCVHLLKLCCGCRRRSSRPRGDGAGGEENRRAAGSQSGSSRASATPTPTSLPAQRERIYRPIPANPLTVATGISNAGTVYGATSTSLHPAIATKL